MKLRIGLLTLSFAALTYSTCAFAATDGDLEEGGTGSQGTSDLQVVVPEVAQITDIDDITVSPYDYATAAGIDQNDSVCIYTNDPGAQYRVTASGSGAASAFTITDGTDTIAYTVDWNNAASAGTNSLTTTVQSAAFNNASGTYPCGANNANFRVRMTHNNIMSAQAGTYTGTLTLVIIPNP